MFGFKTFEEKMFYVTAFFIDSNMEFPRIELNDKNTSINPDNLTEFGQILIVKIFMQKFPQRRKCSLTLNMQRQVVTKYINRWMPLWATYGSHLSMLPISHDYFKKELPDFYIDNDMSNVTHLFDGKDIMIETLRKNDNLRRSTRSEKSITRPAEH